MGLHLNSLSEIGSFYYDDQDLVRHDETFDQLKSGVVLITMQEKNGLGQLRPYQVVLLSLVDYDPATKTGNLKLSYLHNGITGNYVELPMKLAFDVHQNIFQVFDPDEELVTSAYVWTRTMLGREIGIDHVDFKH